MHLDLRSGLLAIENQADGKTYEVRLNSVHVPDNLAVGSQVTVVATFEGKQYAVQSIEVNAGPDQAKANADDSDLAPPTRMIPETGSTRRNPRRKRKTTTSSRRCARGNATRLAILFCVKS